MIYVKRAVQGFLSTAVISTICLLLIEVIANMLGYAISPMTPEFLSHFPTATIAFGVNIILYGLYGASFAGFTFIYDLDHIGFVIQTIIYALATACVWLPIVIFTWQLHKYPQALIFTIIGFIATYVIMIIVNYKTVKQEIAIINKQLLSE